MASAAVHSFDPAHEDIIHDAQFDYYSKRIATCSSDRVIKIFQVGAEQQQTHSADLTGHEGPVWQVQWAHPRFGSLLASCGYDRRVIVWKESPANVWTKVYEYNGHEASVNAIAWAPQEMGLVLAAGSSDGAISILSHNDDDSWTVKVIKNAHTFGCNSVSWAPASALQAGGAQGNDAQIDRRLVSGGCDNFAKVWAYNAGDGSWRLEETFTEHKDWVRAVAWAANIGVPTSTIATGSQDGRVVIWSQEERQAAWTKKMLPPFNAVIYGLSWSPMGNILAVASGDNKVSMFKESLDGQWVAVSSINEQK